MIEHQYAKGNALPPNKWLQLTVQLVTPFAYAKGRQLARQLSLDVIRLRQRLAAARAMSAFDLEADIRCGD